MARLGPHGKGGSVQWTLWLRSTEGSVLVEIALQPYGEVPDASFQGEIAAALRKGGYRARRRAAPTAYWGAWSLEPAAIDIEA